MKPIPTLEELTEIAQRDAKHVIYSAKTEQLIDSATSPLFAAISERGAEIERLMGCLADIRDMPEIDQDDAHRLRHKAQYALGTTEPEPAKPDPYAHLREAEAQGKVIQCNIGTRDHPNWVDIQPGCKFAFSPELYRIKPWTLPPPPEGKSWHRTDWTEEMLPEGWRPLLLGELSVADEEFLDRWNWRTCDASYRVLSYHFHHRTRRPLPEPEVWVDLGPEDVPPGSVFRLSDKPTRHWSNCSYVTKEGARFSEDFISFEDMNKECFQINRSIPLAGKWDLNAWEDCKKLKI